MNEIERTNEHKNLQPKKNEHKINLKIPKRPNFNNKPASHNDIEESTSQ